MKGLWLCLSGVIISVLLLVVGEVWWVGGWVSIVMFLAQRPFLCTSLAGVNCVCVKVFSM